MDHQDHIDLKERPTPEAEGATTLAAAGPGLLTPAALAAGASALLAACGGGGDDAASAEGGQRAAAQAVSIGSTTKPDDHDAWRFLTQATFGPTDADLASLKSLGYVSWLSKQFNSPTRKTLDLVKAKGESVVFDGSKLHRNHVVSAIWDQFVAAPDQLRHRVAFALSQIFVIAMQVGSDLTNISYTCTSFYDALARNAFGSLRSVVEAVCRHPAMGMFLSHINNQRPSGNRIPDQNFARELMQLFTIGLYELNMDGSPKLVNGEPVETYTQTDVEVLSHVFTGWSWEDGFAAAHNNPLALSNPAKAASDAAPMKAYDEHHSFAADFPKNPATGTVTLLGKPFVPAKTSTANQAGSTEADLRTALDILLAHPNVAPFIAKQMIQRLVTSNPTPLYVERAANVFKASGYSLKALVQAILLDTEARDVSAVQSDNLYGKVREPILRVTAFLRAFGATPAQAQGGVILVEATENTSSPSALHALGQSPLIAPSVFNFFRPAYVAPGSRTAELGKVLPEMQITTETAAAAWVRLAERMAKLGFGRLFGTQPSYTYGAAVGSDTHPYACLQPNYTAAFGLASTPSALVDEIGRRLLGGRMSAGLRNHLIAMCNALPGGTTTVSDTHRLARVWSTVFLTLVSAEFITQK